MRKYIFIVGVLLTLFLAGCREGNVNVEKDYLSYKTNEVNVTVKYPVFTSKHAETNRECKLVNEKITALMDSLQNALKLQVKDYLHEAQATGAEPMVPFELNIKDSVFLANNHFISVRFVVYTLTGGANGMTNYYAVNYNLKKRKFLQPEQIMDYNKSAEIDKQIQTNFRNTDNCFTEMPTLGSVTTINFTGSDVCFTYNPLVLGAHYCGAAEVSVPRMILKGDLLLE